MTSVFKMRFTDEDGKKFYLKRKEYGIFEKFVVTEDKSEAHIFVGDLRATHHYLRVAHNFVNLEGVKP